MKSMFTRFKANFKISPENTLPAKNLSGSNFAIVSILAIASIALAACSTSGFETGEVGLPEQTEAAGSPIPKAITPTAEETMPPDIIWDESPQSLIFSATTSGGFVPQIAELNNIPDAQIWGDGRILWVESGPQGARQVMQGRMSQEQVATLFERLQAKGFFSWKELYKPQLAPTDLPTKCLFAQTKERSRKVCEYYEGAPAAFHEIYAWASQGAGVTGEPYTPEAGYLISYPIETPQQVGDQAEPAEWSPQENEFTLSKATQGVWIQGQALQSAWKTVNQQPWGPSVVEGEQAYLISLQIPQVNLIQPPKP
ncbi:MAG: hypothetical protein P8074_01240 [Anaerolineales bacterium]|jgi:hypothetical protein